MSGITKEHGEAVASAVAIAWQMADKMLDGKATLDEVQGACGSALTLAERQAVAADRAYPGKAASSQSKGAWLAQKDEYKGQLALVRTIVTPLLARSKAMASGRIKEYYASLDARDARELHALKRLDAEMRRRGPTPDGVATEIRRSYLGR